MSSKRGSLLILNTSLYRCCQAKPRSCFFGQESKYKKKIRHWKQRQWQQLQTDLSNQASKAFGARWAFYLKLIRIDFECVRMLVAIELLPFLISNQFCEYRASFTLGSTARSFCNLSQLCPSWGTWLKEIGKRKRRKKPHSQYKPVLMSETLQLELPPLP